jgi:hypothetical protein
VEISSVLICLSERKNGWVLQVGVSTEQSGRFPILLDLAALRQQTNFGSFDPGSALRKPLTLKSYTL